MLKLSLLRVRLALVIGTSLGFVLLLGFVLYWGSEQATAYYQRGQAAYKSFDRYERLSQEAYRHFKQRMDAFLANGSENATADVEDSKRRLFLAIEQLRDSVTEETGAAENLGDTRSQTAELESIARVTAFLDANMYGFDEAERLRREGKSGEAARLLSKLLDEDIDARFAPLMDTAIEGERARAIHAGEKMEILVGRLHWVALAAVSTATLFGIAAGFFLLREIQRPMQALMHGTDEIANGNLAYRIPAGIANEFGHLAEHFNRMAHGLELQRNRLRATQAVLERKVAERTLELNKLNRELQHLDQRRRDFFADISHELRTPITVIRGEAEVTLRGRDRDAEEYKEALQRILELAMQQGKMVNDLLFLARAEAAQLQFEMEILDLSELLAGAAEDIEVLAREKSISVGLDIPPEPVWIRGDRQRLRQVMFILGDNACRYSEAGGRIDLAMALDPAWARLSIGDQGIGIPAEDLKSVFERYFRGGNARRPDMQGTGLGLPMAKAIVEAHEGRIGVASVEGEGTTFTLCLPISPESNQPLQS